MKRAGSSFDSPETTGASPEKGVLVENKKFAITGMVFECYKAHLSHFRIFSQGHWGFSWSIFQIVAQIPTHSPHPLLLALVLISICHFLSYKLNQPLLVKQVVSWN